jgi:hypothetical protein
MRGPYWSGERPSVRVKHRQGQRYLSARRRVVVDERSHDIQYALRWVIITPFGRAVVPLV